MEESTQIQKKTNPYEYIHIIRAVATVMVIFNHVRVGTLPFPYDTEWSHIISLLVAPAVPLFVMITGALFLTRSKPIDKRKHAKRILHMIWTTMLWCFVYNIISITLIERHFSAATVIRSLFMALIGDTTYAYQLWYMYLIIGLYMILPILKTYMDSISRREMQVWLVVLFLFGLVVPTFQEITGDSTPLWQNAFCYFGGFLVFAVLGAYLHKYELALWVKIVVAVTWVLQLALIVASTFLRGDHLPAIHTFNSPFIAESATLIYLFYKRFGERLMRPKILNKVTMGLATYSNPIYIFHPMVIMGFNKLLSVNVDFAPVVISSTLIVALVAVCCLFAGWVIRKIPGLKTLV